MQSPAKSSSVRGVETAGCNPGIVFMKGSVEIVDMHGGVKTERLVSFCNKT